MVKWHHDYKRLEIKFKHSQISYVYQRVGCTGNCENEDKKVIRLCKVLDLFLSLLSSICSILKTIFV